MLSPDLTIYRKVTRSPFKDTSLWDERDKENSSPFKARLCAWEVGSGRNREDSWTGCQAPWGDIRVPGRPCWGCAAAQPLPPCRRCSACWNCLLGTWSSHSRDDNEEAPGTPWRERGPVRSRLAKIRKLGSGSWVLRLGPSLALSDPNSVRCFQDTVGAQLLGDVWLFVTLWTVAFQVPLHGILQARILEWVAISSSRVSSWPRDWTHIVETRISNLLVGGPGDFPHGGIHPFIQTMFVDCFPWDRPC